jgi:hypothetical protein
MRRTVLLGTGLITAALALTACGGGSGSGATSASSASGGQVASSSASGGQVASSSAEAFCTTFRNASEKFSNDNTFPTKSQTGEVRKFADEIEATAPEEMKAPAKGLATYFRAVADGVDKHGSNPSPNPSALAAFAASIQAIGAWAQTHCTG